MNNENKNDSDYYVLYIFVLTIVVGLLVCSVGVYVNSERALINRLHWYESNFNTNVFFRSGSYLNTPYKMVTVNGGKTWAFLDKDDHFICDATQATNPALKMAWGWEKLSSYVLKNGPITNVDESTAELLRGIGFEVRTNVVEKQDLTCE